MIRCDANTDEWAYFRFQRHHIISRKKKEKQLVNRFCFTQAIDSTVCVSEWVSVYIWMLFDVYPMCRGEEEKKKELHRKNFHKTDHIIFGYENSRNAHRLS